jgi:hypothetical protein
LPVVAVFVFGPAWSRTKEPEMDTKPSNKLIAEQSGLTEAEVGTYLTALEMQADGSWMVYFGVEVAHLPDADKKIDASRTLSIPSWLAKHWVDRDIG